MNPQQPIAPQPQQAPVPPNQPYTMPPKKSHKVLIWSIVGGVIAFLAILFTVFFIIAYPEIQNRAVADKFMEYMTTDKVSDAAQLTADGNENRDFLDSIAEKLDEGTYELTDDEFNKTGTSYYLFTIKGADVSKARVNLVKKSDKIVVEGIVVGNSLGLKGKVSLQEESDTDTEEESTKDNASSKSSTCYAVSDFDAALGYKNQFVYSSSNPYTTNVHFLGDSTEYSETQESIALDGIDTVIDIVKNNLGKSYAIEMIGGVASNDTSYTDLANQRVQKIKNYMTSRGIDEKAITTTVQGKSGSESDDTSMSIDRVVVVKFIPNCMK